MKSCPKEAIPNLKDLKEENLYLRTEVCGLLHTNNHISLMAVSLFSLLIRDIKKTVGKDKEKEVSELQQLIHFGILDMVLETN